MTESPATRTAPAIRRRLGWLGVAVVLALTPALGVRAEPPASLPNIGLNVATELQRLGSIGGVLGAGALLDDSGSTNCMFDDPEPLTYSTREIVLRTDLSKQQAINRVNAAIGAGPGHAVGAKKIELPSVPPAPGARGTGPLADSLTPIVVVSVKPREQGGPEVEIVKVARVLRDDDVLASPNYLFSPTKDGPIGVWPSGYPKITTVTTPPRDAGLGAGVKVFVYDVGLAPASQSDRPPNVSELVAGVDEEVLDVEPPIGKVDRFYGAHTVGIADVFATLAPAAVVKAVRITNSRGFVTDVTAVTRMSNTLQQAVNPPDVIINSFGSPACSVSGSPSDGEMVPLGLQAITEAIDARGDSVLVAAAGNRSTDRRFYPGAFDTDPDEELDVVVGVGALDVISATDPVDDPDEGMWISKSRTGPPADFSNFGQWVDAWAPGVGLPVRHIDGLRFLKRLPDLQGRGLVNGTSFAAPYVGALIAEQISLTGELPLEAWRSIEAAGVPCSTEFGGTAVALVSMDADPTTPPSEPPEC